MFNILDAVMKKAWPSAKTALPKEIDDAKVRSRLASCLFATVYAPLTLACAWGHLTGTRVCNVLCGPRQRLKGPVLALRAVMEVH